MSHRPRVTARHLLAAATALVAVGSLAFASERATPTLTLAGSSYDVPAADVARSSGVAGGVDAVLARAMTASRELAHAGTLAVVSITEDGPRISTTRVTQDADALHLRPGGDDWEVGRLDGHAFLRSSDALLRVGGVEPPLAQLDRLRDKYEARLGGEVTLDTGAAVVLHLLERSSGELRENLYLDELTGLVVRRETFRADGAGPLRLVAFTQLDADAAAVELPGTEGIDVRDHVRAAVDVDELSLAGGAVPRVLPGGYELLTATSIDAAAPAVHLLYGDGLYTLSLFVQEGRLADVAVRGATRLETVNGGTVWRWPGSEPRRVVWTGGGRTFTVLSDAPTDEVLEVIAGLPADPPPSILDRLHRGADRVFGWLTPGDGSDT